MDNNFRGKSQDRLSRACTYLSDKWIPINPELLKKIQALLASPSQGSFEQATALIQNDLGLFAFLLRAAHQEAGYDANHEESPKDILNALGRETLSRLVEINLPKLHLHSFERSTPEQLQQLDVLIKSSTANKLLCEKSGYDASWGSSVSVLHQIGHLLIAWNYPTVFAKAINEASPDRSLDVILSEILGFAPTTLAIKLIREWHLSPTLTESIAYLDEDRATILENRGVASTIARLCGVGESLARASCPNQYPNARADWNLAKSEIELVLGEDGLEVLDQAIQEQCQQYLIDVPLLFHPGSLKDVPAKIEKCEGTQLLRRNPFLNSCEENVQEIFFELYNSLKTQNQLEDKIALLMKKCVPSVGFFSSALFTLEPSIKRLVLQLRSGQLRLRSGKGAEHPIHDALTDVVPLAFHSTEVISRIGADTEGKHIACLASFFGCSQRFGVFYVEIEAEKFKRQPLVYENNLKALAFSLNDCLELH